MACCVSSSTSIPSNCIKGTASVRDLHLTITNISWTHSYDFNFLPWFQWRNCSLIDTSCKKRKLHLPIKIVIPTHRLLFSIIGVHNDLHSNPLFTFFIFRLLSHMYSPGVDKNWVLAK